MASQESLCVVGGLVQARVRQTSINAAHTIETPGQGVGGVSRALRAAGTGPPVARESALRCPFRAMPRGRQAWPQECGPRPRASSSFVRPPFHREGPLPYEGAARMEADAIWSRQEQMLAMAADPRSWLEQGASFHRPDSACSMPRTLRPFPASLHGNASALGSSTTANPSAATSSRHSRHPSTSTLTRLQDPTASPPRTPAAQAQTSAT